MATEENLISGCLIVIVLCTSVKKMGRFLRTNAVAPQPAGKYPLHYVVILEISRQHINASCICIRALN